MKDSKAIADYVSAVVESAPPLTDEKRNQLMSIFASAPQA